jgi:PAS domain S-box-containing protein
MTESAADMTDAFAAAASGTALVVDSAFAVERVLSIAAGSPFDGISHGDTLPDAQLRAAVESAAGGATVAAPGQQSCRLDQDGETRWFDVSCVPVPDGSGTLVLLEEVTEHRELERRVSQVSEAILDVLWMFFADWEELLFINDAYADIWGMSTDRLAADPSAFLEGVHPDDREAVQAAMARLSGGESVDMEYRVNESEDYSRWVWVQGSPVRDEAGEVVRVVGFVRDITDRKEREQELRTFKNRFETATLVAELGWWELDLLSGHIEFDDSWVAMLGHDPDSFESVTDFRELVHPDDRAAVEEAMQAHLSGDAEVFEVEYRMRTAAEGYRRFHDVGEVAARDETGEPVTVTGMANDVTELRERERQLRVLDRVLRHNVQNGMHVVMGLTESIEHQADGEVAAMAGQILERCRQLVETVEKERDVVEVITNPSERSPLEIDAVIDRAVAIARESFPGLTIDTEGVEPAAVEAVAAFEHAIVELLANAAEHAADSPEDVTVTLDVEVGDDRVDVIVSDDGCGFPPEEIAVLEGDAAVDPLDHGSGMGLWLVRWTVTQSAGHLDVSSDASGVTVTVGLKRA